MFTSDIWLLSTQAVYGLTVRWIYVCNIFLYFSHVNGLATPECSLTFTLPGTCTYAGNSPIDFTGMEPGEHHLKVIPLGCGRRYTALPLKFNVWNSSACMTSHDRWYFSLHYEAVVDLVCGLWRLKVYIILAEHYSAKRVSWTSCFWLMQ